MTLAHADVQAPPRRSTTTRSRWRLHTSTKGALFTLPFLVVFVTMFLLPLGYAAYLSLFTERLIGGTSFVGLDNYVRALADPRLGEGWSGSRSSSAFRCRSCSCWPCCSRWPWTAGCCA